MEKAGLHLNNEHQGFVAVMLRYRKDKQVAQMANLCPQVLQPRDLSIDTGRRVS